MVTAAPAVVIAAPSSGSGKTTVATGLIGALRAAGHRVAPFKVGPDFIDPGYHALAAGRPGRNLDPVLVPEGLIAPLYRHGSRDADVAVIEGVMGLFDGRIDAQPLTPARGSTAQVAELLGAPVVLVVDARGQGQSIAALLQGFSGFHRGVRIGAVILNRVGSARHEQVLRQACEAVGVPVLGAIPRDDELAVPSRHLGLVTAVEHGEAARAAVAAMTALIARHVERLTSGPYDLWFVAGLSEAELRRFPGIGRSAERWRRAVARLVREGVATGEFHPIDAQLAVAAISGLVYGALELRHRHGTVDAGAVAELAVRSLGAPRTGRRRSTSTRR